MPTEPAATLLTMQGISKSFPGVQALENVDFVLNAGEIHALVGENGAGKSTLIKIITGVERPDHGRVTLLGQPVQARSPQHAQALGISTVYQEINLCDNLSVAENILIGREPRKFGRIDRRGMQNRAREILARLDVAIDVTRDLGEYSIAIKQMAAIARALEISSAKILILDEPTSSLDTHETENLFQVLRKLKEDGLGIIFITHFINQIYDVTDRVTILRNGKLVGTYETASLPRLELIALMLGRTIGDFNDMAQIKLMSGQHQQKEPLLQVRDYGRKGSMQPFDLELHAGEVLGFAGLLGSGRTETAHLLFGVDKPDSGSLTFAGQEVHKFSPAESITRGIAFCPEDRKADGVVEDLTVRENIVLALQANRGWFKRLSRQQQQELADKFIKMLNISTPTAEQHVKNLSGGNQQKVILARWLATNPQVLILDEPTRGIDIGAKAEIQKLVLELAEEGKACIFISSELEEVLRTSHRIAVLRDQQKVTEFSGEVDEHTIMRVMAGSGAASSAESGTT
ncbi:MAG: sugar ABC transporter ATP-binding protein [Anaerolineae bacterium]|nr:sugar ABC transporter ATP-binding protein [Anaerolineae bacterium]